MASETERLVKVALGAFAGWLLVGVSGSMEATLRRIGLPLGIHGWFAHLVTTLGWIATLVFGLAVMREAWRSLQRR